MKWILPLLILLCSCKQEYDVWVLSDLESKKAYVVNESNVRVQAVIWSAVNKTLDTVYVDAHREKYFGCNSIYEVIDIKAIK